MCRFYIFDFFFFFFFSILCSILGSILSSILNFSFDSIHSFYQFKRILNSIQALLEPSPAMTYKFENLKSFFFFFFFLTSTHYK